MRIPRTSVVVLALLVSLVLPSRAVRGEDPVPPPAPAGPDVDETRGYIGYAPGFVQRLEEKDRKELGITLTAGLFVAGVTPKSPAEVAGLKKGDVIRKVKGTDLTDADKLGAKDDDAQEKWLSGAFKSLTSTIKPGEEVEMVVDRGGTSVTVKPIAIAKEEMDKLREAAREDEMAVTIPDADGQGAPREAAYDLEKIPEDAVRPTEVLSLTGLWEVREEEDSDKGNHVLTQSSDIGSGYAMALVTGKGLSYTDVTSSVRVRLVSGERSVSAGLVVRARDRKNWYAVIADGVTKKLEIVAMVDLKPTVLASAELGSPKLKTWHTLEVKVVGGSIEASFGGTVKVSAKDTSLKQAGWSGLLTRGDAETDFDDWKLAPVAGK